MNLLELNNLATQNNIEVLYFSHKKDGCAIKLPDGEMVIGLNFNTYSENRQREVLAEELGHCLTDSFYYLENSNSPIYLSNVAKAESTALHKKMELLVDIDKLKHVLHKTKNIYDLSELFDVSTQFMQKTLEYYKCKNFI